MRQYTAVHWLGNETFVEHFEASTPKNAYAHFEECGPNAYDDRQLLSGKIEKQDIERPYGHCWNGTERNPY